MTHRDHDAPAVVDKKRSRYSALDEPNNFVAGVVDIDTVLVPCDSQTLAAADIDREMSCLGEL